MKICQICHFVRSVYHAGDSSFTFNIQIAFTGCVRIIRGFQVAVMDR